MRSAVEQRLEVLEARAALTDLVAAYGRAVDDRDWESLAELYAADSVFDTVGGRLEGRQGVIDYYRERTAQFGPTYHYPHTQEIELHSSTEASGVVCAHAELTIDGEAVRVALRYHDEYRFEDGRWRFAERDVNLLYVMRLSELPTHLADRLRVRWPGTEPQPADLGPEIG